MSQRPDATLGAHVGPTEGRYWASSTPAIVLLPASVETNEGEVELHLNFDRSQPVLDRPLPGPVALGIESSSLLSAEFFNFSTSELIPNSSSAVFQFNETRPSVTKLNDLVNNLASLMRAPMQWGLLIIALVFVGCGWFLGKTAACFCEKFKEWRLNGRMNRAARLTVDQWRHQAALEVPLRNLEIQAIEPC